MNEKGFGLKEFVIIIAVVFICMIIIMALTQNIIDEEKENIKEETKEVEKVTYKDLENKLKKAAERYQNDNYSSNINNEEVWILSYSMLKEEEYLKPIYDIKAKDKECKGYVEFVQDKAKISYTPYLKCENYQTKNYDDSLID